MTIRQQLEQLATETNHPCVTISLNTHRTHPDNAQDDLQLKNLLKEARERIVEEFGKRPVDGLLQKIEALPTEIDVNYNLNSLHIYLSNDTQEVIRSPHPTFENRVHIADKFALRPLLKVYNRSEEYLLLLLSQSGVQLFDALNDGINAEIRNADFPFSETRHYNTHSDRGSDSKHLDDLVREFLNKVDKAVVQVHNETGLTCVVVCTEDNYSRLMQVADKPGIYAGHASINYNQTALHHIAEQGWEVMEKLQQERKAEAVSEMKEAVAKGNVYTDLQDIYLAALDGRGDLLIIHEEYSQPVIMTGDRSFTVATDPTQPGVVDDITNQIAWEVLSKKGRVSYTAQDEIRDLGPIVMKTRY